MGRSRQRLSNHTLDLFKLLHQVILGCQATSSIDNQHITFTGNGGMDGVMRHSGSITAFLAHQVYPIAHSPLFELIACSRSKGIPCSQ